MKVYTRQDKFWGLLRTDAPPKGLMAACTGFFIFTCIAAVFMFFFLLSCDYGFGFTLVFTSVLVGLGSLLLIARNRAYKAWESFCEEMRLVEEKKKKEEEAAFLKEHPHYQEEQFYLACKKAKINNITERANIARLQLVARQCGIKVSDDKLIAMYTVGENQINATKKAAQIQKAQKEEQLLEASSKRYIRYIGREKTIKMLKDEAIPFHEKLAQCKQDREIIRNGSNAMYELGKEKEQDWALLGGIASGLAGGAAGLATAIDVQSKNAQTRAYNDALLRSTTTMAFDLEMQLNETERKAKEDLAFYQNKIAETELKLIAELSETQLLELLNPKAMVRVTVTGAAKITVRTSATKNLKIYDSVSAVVDGTIKVHLLKDGKKVGYAYATLPVDGAKNDCSIKTICIAPKEHAEKYEVVFEPHHLWAIES